MFEFCGSFIYPLKRWRVIIIFIPVIEAERFTCRRFLAYRSISFVPRPKCTYSVMVTDHRTQLFKQIKGDMAANELRTLT